LIAIQENKVCNMILINDRNEDFGRVKRLQSAVDTRWSSFYTMLERICALKDALRELAEFEFDYIHLNNDGEPTPASATLKTRSRQIEVLMLSDEKFDIVTKLRDVLLRFSLMRKRTESSFCPLSEIPPFVKKSRSELKNIKRLLKFTQALRKALKERFTNIYTEDILLAVVTDPRYKNLDCLIDEKINKDAALTIKALELFQAVYVRSSSNAKKNSNNNHQQRLLKNHLKDEAQLLFETSEVEGGGRAGQKNFFISYRVIAIAQNTLSLLLYLLHIISL